MIIYIGKCLSNIDILVDEPFIEDLKSPSLENLEPYELDMDVLGKGV